MKEKQEKMQMSNEKPKPNPKMRLVEFSLNGQITFHFDQSMIVPDSLRNFTFTTRKIMPQANRRDLEAAKV